MTIPRVVGKVGVCARGAVVSVNAEGTSPGLKDLYMWCRPGRPLDRSRVPLCALEVKMGGQLVPVNYCQFPISLQLIRELRK